MALPVKTVGSGTSNNLASLVVTGSAQNQAYRDLSRSGRVNAVNSGLVKTKHYDPSKGARTTLSHKAEKLSTTKLQAKKYLVKKTKEVALERISEADDTEAVAKSAEITNGATKAAAALKSYHAGKIDKSSLVKSGSGALGAAVVDTFGTASEFDGVKDIKHGVDNVRFANRLRNHIKSIRAGRAAAGRLVKNKAFSQAVGVLKEAATRAIAAMSRQAMLLLPKLLLPVLISLAIIILPLLLAIPFMGTAGAAGQSASQGEVNGLSAIESQVYLFLKEKGLNDAQIAGIMGNIYGESSFDPSSIEAGSGEGFGLIQWSFGRKTALFNYAQEQGRSASDVGLQLEFLWSEFTGGGWGSYTAEKNTFLNTEDVDAATHAFMIGFERPGDQRYDVRLSAAKRYYAAISAPPTDNEMIARAYTIIGSGYSWSGYNWTGSASGSWFTCSGVVDYSLGRPPRTSWPESEYAAVKAAGNLRYSLDQLKPGDLVFFTYAGRYPGHVGIYIGNGQMIDSTPGRGVQVRNVGMGGFIGGGYYPH